MKNIENWYKLSRNEAIDLKVDDRVRFFQEDRILVPDDVVKINVFHTKEEIEEIREQTRNLLKAFENTEDMRELAHIHSFTLREIDEILTILFSFIRKDGMSLRYALTFDERKLYTIVSERISGGVYSHLIRVHDPEVRKALIRIRTKFLKTTLSDPDFAGEFGRIISNNSEQNNSLSDQDEIEHDKGSSSLKTYSLNTRRSIKSVSDTLLDIMVKHLQFNENDQPTPINLDGLDFYMIRETADYSELAAIDTEKMELVVKRIPIFRAK